MLPFRDRIVFDSENLEQDERDEKGTYVVVDEGLFINDVTVFLENFDLPLNAWLAPDNDQSKISTYSYCAGLNTQLNKTLRNMGFVNWMWHRVRVGHCWRKIWSLLTISRQTVVKSKIKKCFDWPYWWWGRVGGLWWVKKTLAFIPSSTDSYGKV